METLLTVTDLVKTYGDRRALGGAHLEIARGEIVGIVGENGAGKSTLVNIIGGVIQPDSGTMLLDDEPYRAASPAEALELGIGSIQQQFTVDPEHTVAQNMYRGTLERDAPAEHQQQLARELIESVGLDVDPARRMGDLVRAEQAIVEVLRLMAEHTQLVLLDEVAAAFNDYEIAQLHELMRRIARQGRAIVYITHRVDEISSLAHRVFVLRDGYVMREFEPRAMAAADIAYEITGRELEFDSRPAEHASDEVRMRVRDLSTPDGAVQGVSFDVRRGEILGLTGLRRAGMSELAAALVGAAPATWSSYRKDDVEVELRAPGDAVAHRIGYLSDRDDQLGIDAERTIAENLTAGRETGDLLEDFEQLREAIAHTWRLRIDGAGSSTQVGALSVGNQQKVAVARLMGAGFDVLVLNHPTRGIDVGARRDIIEMLHELAAAGTSIVFVSSDLTELVEVCHRIGVMRGGQLVSMQPNAEADEDSLMMAALGGGYENDTAGRGRGRRRA